MEKRRTTALGQAIKARREQLGISNMAMADRAQIDRGLAWRIENGGIQKPDPRKLSRIAVCLDLPVADLYALAGYQTGHQLPSLQPYLRQKYGDLPSEALDAISRYVDETRRRFGAGPVDGEDEDD